MEEPDWAAALGPGAWTDLAVDMLAGTEVTDRGDHLIVRTPANPTYMWGNCLIALTEPDAAEHWVRSFAEAFPGAGHVAIGLPGSPDPKVWAALDLTVEYEQVLLLDGTPASRPCPDGVEISPLTTRSDWDAVVDLFDTDNDRSGEFPSLGYREFLRRRGLARQRLAADGHGVFLGAWDGDRLVGHVGIVACGSAARYQSVLVDADWRRRGLASHLITECGTWAQRAGCVRQVIVAEAGSDAGRLYAALGFVPGERMAGVERPV